MFSRHNAQEVHRSNIVQELICTERKYVRDLEKMQKYATALSQLVDQEIVHLLFPNIDMLVDFQWKFLLRLEGSADLSWQDQRWGWHFLRSEEEFSVYERYCANYINISDISHLELGNEHKFAVSTARSLANQSTNAAQIQTLNHLIHFKTELATYVVKPVSRVCKYPLLLDSLIRASSPADQHYDELESGLKAARRVTGRVNEAMRIAENEQTVKSLRTRVQDWRGHRVDDFGELLLDEILTVTRYDIDREYHVFLFERIMLFGKGTSNDRKGIRSNNNQRRRRTTPLLLKGRISVASIMQVQLVPSESTQSTWRGDYPLAVWWEGDHELESFTLRCRSEFQMRQWETQLNRLISECAQRRPSEHSGSNIGAGGTDTCQTETCPEESVDAQADNISNGPPGHPLHDGGASGQDNNEGLEDGPRSTNPSYNHAA
ncbi:Dbl homology domain-containing protein, partial [Mycena epipterygia]